MSRWPDDHGLSSIIESDVALQFEVLVTCKPKGFVSVFVIKMVTQKNERVAEKRWNNNNQRRVEIRVQEKPFQRKPSSVLLVLVSLLFTLVLEDCVAKATAVGVADSQVFQTDSLSLVSQTGFNLRWLRVCLLTRLLMKSVVSVTRRHVWILTWSTSPGRMAE